MNTKILLVRHGETEFNREKRIQGHLDIPLSEKGIEQAKESAKEIISFIEKENIKSVAIYSSDLKRAARTAEETLKLIKTESKIKICVDFIKELREINLGQWEGKSKKELLQQKNSQGISLFRQWYDHPEKVVPPGGEFMYNFFRRCCGVLERLSEKHKDDLLILFTHGGVVSMILNYIYGRTPENFIKFATPNGVPIYIEKSNDNYRIISDKVKDWIMDKTL